MTATLCRYATDADGRLVFVDCGWREFALENAAPDYAVTERLYGRRLLSFISEPTTLHIYSVLMDRVANDRLTISVPFRCDAPALRRWLELQMSPRESGGINFETRQLRTEMRPVPLSFERQGTRRDLLVRMCSWCKDVEVASSRWGTVEDAVRTLHIFADSDVPLITHGICPDCVAIFERDARR